MTETMNRPTVGFMHVLGGLAACDEPDKTAATHNKPPAKQLPQVYGASPKTATCTAQVISLASLREVPAMALDVFYPIAPL
jgi:hypothetical protein